MHRSGIIAVQHDDIAALDCAHFDFRTLDGTQMQTRFQPPFEKDVVDSVGCAHRDICAGECRFRSIYGDHLDAEFCSPFARKCLAIGSARTETADQLDRTYRAHTHGLTAGLPPRTT